MSDDDENEVCPLCCEDLDISDQQFYPCKCGYQVCMWCWHRIKESETGLCPACRTPYGDDPHAFSAVDMEEVIKANKAKQAAEKRERERIRQQQTNKDSGAGGMSSRIGNMHIGGGSDGDLAVAIGSRLPEPPPPKERFQLHNSRVVRRNLVYAVGLPHAIATEETLKRPEYFGQYGKIAKIIIKRGHPGNVDPRRASASAYVTFVSKEDTLACILALDGFFYDGRNIRATHGTSKYCSAFIKNVRCNNPDCTYLHCMGEEEDTFTKQEIQAGYVTSGPALAKMQQTFPGAKKRTGGGGPSGTGRMPANPIFPPPTYDEQPKQSNQLVPTPGSFPPMGDSSANRSGPIGMTGFPSVASGNRAPSAVAQAKAGRSMSLNSTSTSSSVVSHGGASQAGKNSKGAKASGNLQLNGGTPKKNISKASRPPPATAASVVAGLRMPSKMAPPPAHTVLSSLTPLNKRGSTKSTSGAKGGNAASSLAAVGDSSMNMPVPKGMTPAEQAAFLDQRKEAMASMARHQQEKISALRSASNVNAVAASQTKGAHIVQSDSSARLIGGSAMTSSQASAIGSSVGAGSALGGLGGSVLGAPPHTSQGLSSIGGSAFDGEAFGGIGAGSVSVAASSRNAILGGLGGSVLPPVGGGRALGSNATSPLGAKSAIGSQLLGQTNFSNGNSGSSALASMLGIELPTGSGSLSQSSSLWGNALPSDAPPIQSSQPEGMISQPIGGGVMPSGGGVIGGTINGGVSNVPIGGFNSNVNNAATIGNNSRDMELLQVLLPGVQITGDAQQPSLGGGLIIGAGGWGSSLGGDPQQQMIGGTNQGPVAIGGLGLQQQQVPLSQQQQGFGADTWGSPGLYGAPVDQHPGAKQQQRQQSQQQQQQQQQPQRSSNIW